MMDDILGMIPESKDNPITRWELAAVTGLDDRTIRREIKSLRESTDIAILNSQDGRGYWISDDPKEIEAWLNQERHRMREIGKSLKSAKKALKRIGYDF